MHKKLYKSRRNTKFDGVCGGIAEYLALDPTLVRLVWVLLVFFGGSGIPLYIICMILIPREPEYTVQDYSENREN